MADDPWAAFKPEAAATTQADPWASFKPEAAPAAADEKQPAPDLASVNTGGYSSIPPAFMDRLARGSSVDRILGAAVDSFKEGLGAEPVTGISDETRQQMIDIGLIHDPAKGGPGPIHLFNEAAIVPAAKAFETLIRGVNAGLYGAAGSFGQIVEELGGQGDKAKREAINAGNWAMIESGMGRFTRPGPASDHVVGTLPRAEDFKNAAAVVTEQPEKIAASAVKYEGKTYTGVIHSDAYEAAARENGVELSHVFNRVAKPENGQDTGFITTTGRYVTREEALDIAKQNEQLERTYPNQTMLIAQDVEDNLRRLWQEKGLHPSEVAHDAQSDAFLRHDLTAKGIETEMPREALETLPGVPRSLGAEVTSMPPDISPSVQPLKPPGSLASALHAGADKLFDIGKDMQMLVAPMATGTNESMAIAKDFANTMRRNRWEWSRADADIEKRFTPEQRTRMWNAADEESVARQLGESTEHQGLVTLAPEERAAVEALQSRAQVAWARARDLGMVEGEGLPAYTPRMVINASSALSGDKAIPLNGLGLNLRTRTSQMMHRAYMTAEETEAAMKKGMGADAEIARDIRALPLATGKLEDAIAGRSLIENIKDYGKRTGTEAVVEGAIPAGSDAKWFTLDHPAFRTWRPKYEKMPNGDPALEGNMLKTVKDADGHIVFEQVPIYVHGDFEGPLRAVLTQRSGETYKAMMELKGKTMGLIMNSPLIHLAVEYGRAFPAMPIRIFKAGADGFRAKHDVALMTEAIDSGLVPIGKRFFNQDITSVMEAPDLSPGRSLTSKILATVPGLFDEAAGTAVKRAVDKAGDFWHNTLLWDKIANLQMGLYTNLRGDLLQKGVDQQTASRMAAHFANRYAGALPKEAMSDGATKIANMLLFSRTFTIGNLGVIKDALTGLPKDVMAQIIRDAGELNPAAAGYAKAMARRKAFSVVMLDIGALYVGNSVLQSALNIMLMDSSIDQEAHGYAKRFKEVLNESTAHPLSMVTPMSVAGGAFGAAMAGPVGAAAGAIGGSAISLLSRLSSTAENEPGKQERLKMGYAKDGTAIYARNPVGKIGEEFLGYMNSPIEMLKKKEGTIARPIFQVIENDKGFGRKIYDKDAETPLANAQNMWNIITHIAKSQTPEGQVNAFADLVKGEGDPKVNALQAFGPIAGVTFSKGAPGGPAVGEMYAEKSKFDFRVGMAMPDIRRQILRGDVPGAQKAMTELGMDPGYQRWVIKTSQNPATRLGARALHNFYMRASPEQRNRMENLRSPGPLTPDQ